MPVELSNRQRKRRVDAKLLRQRAQEILDRIGRADAELSITLLSDPAIRDLNKTWRGKDAPTDVLSFAMSEGEFGELNPGDLLGDVIISVETAERQAAARDEELGGQGYGLDDELSFLLVHGVLHLIGYDHEQDDLAREMEAKELELVQGWSTLPPRPHHVAEIEQEREVV